MKNLKKQLAGLGILLFGFAMLTFMGCPSPDGNGNGNGGVGGGGGPSTQYWTVTFDTNGGNHNPAQIRVENGKSMNSQYPNDPEKDDYTFDGWYLASDTGFIGTKYDADTPITKNTDLKAKWEVIPGIKIKIEMEGETDSDNVSASPQHGEIGDVITLTYSLANTKANNRLAFSGTKVIIEKITTAGSGTITYTIAGEDATDKIITIIASFEHSDKTLDTIAFADTNNETKTYNTTYTKAISSTGSGTGAITYASSDVTVATVNATTGAVTILKVGTTTITATKAEDANYAGTTASYLLTVEPLQLTIGTPTVTTTKQYDGTKTAAVTVGTLTNKVTSDTVTVTAEAEYASENVGTGIKITVVYSIDGADADNYNEPVNYETTGAITKATGRTVTVPTMASKKHNSITVNAVTLQTPTYDQTAEYTISSTITTVAGLTGSEVWQDGLTLSNLTASTTYYVYARSKENANCGKGVAQVSAAITTNAPPPPLLLKYDFSGGETIPASYPGLSGSYPVLSGNISSANIVTSNATDGFFKDKKVLNIIKNDNNNYTSPKFVLPFNLGDKTLADYSHIILVARSASASNVDQGNKKMFVVEAGSSSTRLSTDVNNNFNLGNNNTNTVMTIIMPISLTTATQNLTGVVELGFLLDNLKGVNFEIASITLIGSPFGYNIAGGDTIPTSYPPLTGSYPVLSGNISSANIAKSNATDGFFKDKQVLTIIKTDNNNYTSPKFVLPFNLGSNTLADYSYIILVARSASATNVDQSNKKMFVHAGSTTTRLSTDVNNNFNLGNVNNNNVMTIIMQIDFTPAKNYTGVVELGFFLDNLKGVNFEIASISLLR